MAAGSAEALPKFPEHSNLDILKHPNLDDSPQFLELKNYLSQFLTDRRKPKERQRLHIERSATWRDNLYNSLQCLLGEVTYTKDCAKQAELLEKVYNWYMGKVQGGSGLPRLPEHLRKSPTPAHTRTVSKLGANSSMDTRGTITPEPKVRSSPIPYLPGRSNSRSDAQSIVSNLNQRYTIVRKREGVALKAAEARAYSLAQWSQSKSRFREERARRLEQARYQHSEYSLGANREEVPSPVTDKSAMLYDFRHSHHGPSSSSARGRDLSTKLQKLRQIHGKLIDVEAMPEAKKSRSKLTAKDPEPEIPYDYSPLKRGEQEQLDEVLIIKNKLASNKISCSLQQLENGLMLPEVPITTVLTADMFPKCGEKLISNPFKKAKKAKKGKKGKKGKKKKK